MRSPHGNRLWASTAGRERRRRRGFSLIEAAVSVVIVGGVLVVALNTVAASKRTQYMTGTRGRGQLLAQALMAEILSQPFAEADAPDSFGLEDGESSEKRDRYDDVDDYRNWSASPPEDKDGQVIPGFEGWTRTATVVWVNPWDLTTVAWAPTGIKRITVTVKRGELVVASMVAVRTEAWPKDDDDDTVKVLFVVTNAGSPTSQEQTRKALMEEWGFVVTLINASAPQSAFDVAAGKADVAYVSCRVVPEQVGTKLRNTTVGVVNEEAKLIEEFGIAGGAYTNTRYELKIVNNTHYITSGLPLEYITVYTSTQTVYLLDWGFAPGFSILGEYHNVGVKTHTKPAMGVVDAGGELRDGDTAAGRRVQLPWGADSFNINALNDTAKTIMKRSIEWAASKEQPE